MAIVVPIVLSHSCTNVVRVISLYPVLPIFPNSLRASQFNTLDISTYPRDTSQLSKGFPHSINLDIPNYNLSTNQSVNTLVNPLSGIVFPVPPNAYSFIDGVLTGLPGSNGTSVLLIDCTVAPIEPGLSRLRVDYVDDNYSAQTDYLDMPFWEGWDNHPSEIQQIVDYAEETIQYIQDEIVILQDGVFDALERAQSKGIHVSGSLGTTQAKNTYNPITQQSINSNTSTSHGMSLAELEAVKFEASEFASKKYTLASKTTNFPYNITTVTPESIFAGETITVTLDAVPGGNFSLFLGTIKLKTTISGNTLSAVIPTNLTYGFTINLRVGNAVGVPMAADYNLDVLALPKISNIFGKATGSVVPNAQFTLSGSNFGTSKGATTITFNEGLSATITLWSPTKIAGIVPNNATTGFVLLTTDNGRTAQVAVNVIGPNQTDVFTIIPNIVAVTPGQTLQFTSLLNGTSVVSNWSMVTVNGNVATGNVGYGFVNPTTGLYTAPSNVFSTFNLNIVANHVTSYGNVYASTSIVVLASENGLTITPNVANIQINNTQLFTLSNNGSKINNVAWYVNGLLGGSTANGQISQSGLYQAPPVIPQNSSVYITGVANSGSAGTAAVQITPPQSVYNQTSVAHGMNLQAKDLGQGTGTASCIPDVYNVLNGTVGMSLTISDWSMSSNQNGSYYVTAYNQPSCGNQDGIISISDGTSGTNYGTVYFTPQSVGFYSIVVYVSTVSGSTTTANQYYYQINVIQASPPILMSATQACPNNTMTISGQNFPSDSQIRIVSTNQPLQIEQFPTSFDGVNYSMNVLLPSSLSNAEGTQYSYYLYSPSVGKSNELTVAIPSGCGAPPTSAVLNITPGQTTYTNNQNIQFTAILQLSDGTNNEVTTSTVWYVLSSEHGIDNSYEAVQGGNSVLGTINTEGLYTAPSSGNPSVTIIGQNSFNNSPIVGYSFLTFLTPPPAAPDYQAPPTGSTSDCIVLLISPNFQTVPVPGPGIQFTCTCKNVTKNTSALIKPDTWFVNGVPGGDAVHGFIDSDGYYTPPEFYPPNDYAETEVGARYNFTATNGNVTLNNYGIISYYQSINNTTGNCEVTLASQINFTFGDGRTGYILQSALTISLLAGNYLLATYQETLDGNFLPIVDTTPQEMFLTQASAQAPDLATVIYNQGQIYASTTPGQYTRPYTVVLGICDPTTGKYQSMWDEILIVQPIQNDIPLAPTNCDVSIAAPHEMLTQNITTQLKAIEPIKVVPTKFIWAAKGSYDNEILTFEDVPKLLSFDSNGAFFKSEKIGTATSFVIKPEQILVCVESDAEKKLSVLSMNDTIPENSHIYVLGVVLDKFYSLSPFLAVKNGFIMYQAKNQVMRLGNMLMQWGSLSADNHKITFDIPFKSYTLNVSPGVAIQKSMPSFFDYTIINKNTNTNWFAIGS